MTGLNKAYALFLVQHQELDLCHCSNERRSSGFMHRSSHFDSIDLARCKFALEKSAFAREVGGGGIRISESLIKMLKQVIFGNPVHILRCLAFHLSFFLMCKNKLLISVCSLFQLKTFRDGTTLKTNQEKKDRAFTSGDEANVLSA